MSRDHMPLPLQFKQVDTEDSSRSSFSNKRMVSEIYFPRMLSTKVREEMCVHAVECFLHWKGKMSAHMHHTPILWHVLR